MDISGESMDAFQIIAIALTGAVLSITVKQYKPELSIGIGIVTGIIIFFSVAEGISEIFSIISEIMYKSGVSQSYLAAVLKVVGISYVTQFSAEVCRDSGQGAIASKLEIAGKIIILLYTLPIVSDFLDILINAVELLG